MPDFVLEFDPSAEGWPHVRSGEGCLSGLSVVVSGNRRVRNRTRDSLLPGGRWSLPLRAYGGARKREAVSAGVPPVSATSSATTRWPNDFWTCSSLASIYYGRVRGRARCYFHFRSRCHYRCHCYCPSWNPCLNLNRYLRRIDRRHLNRWRSWMCHLIQRMRNC